MPKFGAQVDLLEIPLKNARFEQLAAAPTGPAEGRIYHDTALKSVRAYLNGAWIALDATSTRLRDLTDVSTTSPTTGQVLRWSGSQWAPGSVGTADVAGLQAALDAKVSTSTTISAGAGLTGGGNLSANRSLAVNFAASGSASTTQAVRADDSRLSDSRTPTGTAGGALTGNFPNPSLRANAVGLNEIDTALQNPAAGTAGLRSLGFGASNALPGNVTVDQLPVAGNVDMQVWRLTNLEDPLNAQDAATKHYVDSIAQGLSTRQAVRLATTGNISLTSAQTIDGVAVQSGNRVLVKNQSNSAQNGIYQASTEGAWQRIDMDARDGAFWFVQEGGQASSGWVLTTNGDIVWGTTSVVFEQFSGAGQVEAGNGLTKTGNTLAVGQGAGIRVNAGNIMIDPNYPGQTSITSVGAITNGQWNATAIAVARGGTGATTAAQARANLAVAGDWTGTVGALAAGAWTNITHGLGTAGPSVSFLEEATGDGVVLDWRRVDTNTVAVKSDVAYPANAIRVVVTG